MQYWSNSADCRCPICKVKCQSSELTPESAEILGETLHRIVNSDFNYLMDRLKALESRLSALEAVKVPENTGKHFAQPPDKILNGVKYIWTPEAGYVPDV